MSRTPEDDDTDISLDAVRVDRDRDGVSSLRDVEAESGDEEELEDVFDRDERALRDSGAQLDEVDHDEPGLT